MSRFGPSCSALHVRCNVACAACCDPADSNKVVFPCYTGTVYVSQNTWREDRVSAHIHTRRRARVCIRARALARASFHVFLYISCCVSGCSDSRNLAEASLSVPLQHFKVGWSTILRRSYSSRIFFISPTVTDKTVESLLVFPAFWGFVTLGPI